VGGGRALQRERERRKEIVRRQYAGSVAELDFPLL